MLITRITLRVITGYITLDYIIIIRKLIFVNQWSERREYFSGVYVIFALKGGRIELVKIGSTNLDENLLDQIIKEQLLLKSKLHQEKIEALDIYWYVTQTNKVLDDPHKVMDKVIKTHTMINGKVPRWNSVNENH